MASIEDRIVQMQFDNTGFERKMSSTIANLEKLNATIAKAGSKNGLEEISRSARNFSLSGMTNSIEGVSKKFLAMSTIAITALATIASRALTTGTRLISSMTLKPIMDGFREYELQIGAIQTVLSNTAREGTTLSQVNDALDVLNQYSDKTIYNFGEMTKNIGTFTAAGVDLDTSVAAIKGIANLAAISGSSSLQASTAMYQLSQAIANGSVKLMDWNSVVNAGMGGEVFQRALFDTGVAMQTIQDVPMGTTFEDWTKAGNSFRGSLQDGWLTSEVLTNTLQAFTGEMTEAQLTAIGFTKEQAQEMIKLGQSGVEAATKVRTFTQLITTTKEALGSGWSQSFRIIFGDFEEATKLWTRLSDAIGGVVSKNADARNEMLKTWDELGGRAKIIKAIQTAFKALGEILAPIKKAFRDIFPAATGERLFELTQGFNQFARALRPSEDTIKKLRQIFRGFFAALEIGWTVIKEGVKFVADLANELLNFGSGNFSKGLAKIANFVTNLHEMLVTEGGIKEFFHNLRDYAKAPIEFIKALVKSIQEFFKSLSNDEIKEAADSAGDALKRFGDRFSGLKDITSRIGDIWAPFKKSLSGINDDLDKIWEPIKNWFKDLGKKLADVMEPGDYDKALDTFNTAFLGGLVLLLKKFLDGGLKINFNGGILDSITDTFGELTGVLKAMQTDLKANALLKIAAALGILSLSLLLLATINSADLTRALTAMAVGFGQLVIAFGLLNTIAFGPVAAGKLTILAGGLILLSTAMLILSGAVRILSGLDWSELLKGLVGVTAMLAAISLSALILGKASGTMILSSVGLIAVAIAMNILALAVRQFASMSWEDIGKGMAAIAGGLLIIAIAMNLMPATMPLIGAGLLLVAISLPILAGAVKLLAMMSWGEIAKGMTALAGGLLIIAAAMNLMPVTLPITAAGLILVSVALIGIAKALSQFAGLSWSEIARGLTGMAGALLILAAGTHAMSGAIAGAVAIGVVAASLLVLIQVIKEIANIDTGELIKGLLGMAGIFVILGLSAALIYPLIPAMLALGAAMILLGAGLVLFGLGAQGIAKAFELLGKAGGAGISVLMDLIDGLIHRLPEMGKAAARGIQGFAAAFLEGTPPIVKALVVLIEHILDGLIKLIPKAAKLIGDLTSALLKHIRDKVPEFVETGFKILMSFLAGIRSNIGEITKTVADIITRFLDALAEKVPEIIDSVYNLILAVFEGVIMKLVEVHVLLVQKGVEFISGLIGGMNIKLPEVVSFFTSLPGRILRWIGSVAKTLLAKGVNVIQGFLDGIVKKAVSVTTWFTSLPGRIIRWIGGVASTIRSKGVDIVQGFLNGVIARAVAVTGWFTALPGRIIRWIGGVASTIRSKGVDIVQGFLNGVIARAVSVANWFSRLPSRVVSWVGSVISVLRNKGHDILVGFVNGAVAFFNETLAPWFRLLPGRAVTAVGDVLGLLYQKGKDIIQGLWNGLIEKWDAVWAWIQDKINMIPGFLRGALGIGSPSKLMMYYGEMIGLGLAKGLENNSGLSEKASQDMVSKLRSTVNNSMLKLVDDIGKIDKFNPTITPVLDLTRVKRDAAAIASLIPNSYISPTLSYAQAQTIAQTSRPFEESVTSDDKSVGNVSFEQNIYAPKQLSTGEIYRQTRNQIAMAKEELAIP